MGAFKLFLKSTLSGHIAWISVTAFLALAVYVQTLRVQAAYCKGQQSVVPAVEKLTDRLTKKIEQSADRQVDDLRKVESDCLDQPSPLNDGL